MSQQKAVRPEWTQTSTALQLPGLVSSAAGTTLPDNSESGGLAYVIAVLAMVFMLTLGMGIRGAITLFVSAVDKEMVERSQRQSQPLDYGWGDGESVGEDSQSFPPFFTRNDTTMG